MSPYLPISRATPGETTVGFAYAATGNRATMTDASGTTTYNYDTANQLISKATPEGTLTYTYDAAGNLASMTSSNTNGASVSYSYDLLNRLSTVVDNRLTGNRTTTYSYNTANNMVTVAYPNGLTSTLSYGTLNRLTELSTPPVADYNYALGLTGNRTGATEHSGRSVTWSYDNIYRLTQEQIAGDPAGINGTVSYTGLDSVGNRTSDTSTIPSISALTSSYNLDDEMSTETYDANGNTTGTGGNTFAYDSENHLVSMNSGAVTVVYDGDGSRVAKTTGGVTTQYLVDDLNPTGYAQVIEEVVGGVVKREYTYGLQRINENQLISGMWTPSFYGYDGGGSVRQLTNAAGTITDAYNYDAFGNRIGSSGTTPNNYMYRGEQYDSDLGLYYLRARYYNPQSGRFLSRDPEDGKPVDPKTLHKYLYAGGDPVKFIDPRGRKTITRPGNTVGEYLSTASDSINLVLLYAEVTVPEYIARIGSLQFWGGVGGITATGVGLAQWFCEITQGFNGAVAPALGTIDSGRCGVVEVDPGPGQFEPDAPPTTKPGSAGAQK
jgi:RHS repeat-associated protein